jgi:hypothetical protein
MACGLDVCMCIPRLYSAHFRWNSFTGALQMWEFNHPGEQDRCWVVFWRWFGRCSLDVIWDLVPECIRLDFDTCRPCTARYMHMTCQLSDVHCPSYAPKGLRRPGWDEAVKARRLIQNLIEKVCSWAYFCTVTSLVIVCLWLPLRYVWIAEQMDPLTRNEDVFVRHWHS